MVRNSVKRCLMCLGIGFVILQSSVMTARADAGQRILVPEIAVDEDVVLPPAGNEANGGEVSPEVAADEDSMDEAEVAADENIVATKGRKRAMTILVWCCIAVSIGGACTMIGVGVTEIVRINKNHLKKDE